VLDPAREPAPLELREQPEFAELVEPHRSSILLRAPSVSGSGANARGTSCASFAGTNRIRFDECDLSRERGTPVLLR
jgi:hypothetical protein